MSTHIGFFVGPGFEDLEFWVPYMRLIEEGFRVTVIGLEAGETYASKHGCLSATAEMAARTVDAAAGVRTGSVATPTSAESSEKPTKRRGRSG